MENKNALIAAKFERIAELIPIHDTNEGAWPYRVSAYKKAAGVLRALDAPVQEIVGAGTKVKGLGDSSMGKVLEYITTGKLEYLDRLEELNERVQQETGPKRIPKEEVEELVHEFIEEISEYADQLRICGSWRRGKALVKDCDIVVGFDEVASRSAFIAKVKSAVEAKGYAVVVSGEAIIRFRVPHPLLEEGFQIDIRLCNSSEFGATQLFYTGSKEFNIEMRGYAKSQGLRLNEHGLFRCEELLAAKDEEAIFSALGVAFVAPKDRNPGIFP